MGRRTRFRFWRRKVCEFKSRLPHHFSLRQPDGVSPSGKAPVFDTGIPWFESRYPSQSDALSWIRVDEWDIA